MKKLLFLILLSFFYSQNLFINNIEINGIVTATESQIYRNSGLRPSEPFIDLNSNGYYDFPEVYTDINNNNKYDFGTEISRGDEFNNAIKNLWKLNVFSDVNISIVNSTDKYVNLLINVLESPIVSDIKISGNKKIRENRILEKIELKKSQRVSPNLVYSLKEVIKNLYIEEGYHQSNINIKLLDDNTNYSKIVNIVIDEGKKMKVKKITITGNYSIPRPKILKSFEKIKERKWYKFWQGNFSKNDLDNDINNLIMLYKNNGFRDVRILESDVIYNDKSILINININEGEKNYYNKFTFEGNFIFSDEELLERLGLSSEEIFSDEKFKSAIYKLNSKYMDEGYYFIQIQNNIVPVGTNKLNVSFNINESEKTKVRKIIISGNDKTHDNVIRRELLIHPGDTFSMKKLEESYREIFMLDYFESVNPQILTINNTQSFVDVDFEVIEKETGRANFSMGYNEVYGLTGGGGFDFANFRGKGQMLSINYNRGLQNQSQFSGTTNTSNSNNNDFQSFSVSFREPRIFDTNNSIGFSYSHSEQGTGSSNVLKYDIVSDRGSILFGRRFDWPDYFFRGSWTLSIKNTEYLGLLNDLYLDFGTNIVNQIDSVNGSATRSGVSINQVITRDSRNHPEFSTAGSRFIWTGTYSGGVLGGDENYHRQVFSFDWYTGLKPKIVFYQNLKFGALMELEENQFIPYSARFLLGGSGLPSGEMLRGYPDNGIGPKVNIGSYYNYDGGKVMMKYSTELRFKFSESPTIYMLLFAEAGNIWTDFDTVDMFKLKRSLGLGFRINMPMLGTLGYDVGYGFDSIYDDPSHSRYNEPFGWEHHLLFGMPMN